MVPLKFSNAKHDCNELQKLILMRVLSANALLVARRPEFAAIVHDECLLRKATQKKVRAREKKDIEIC